MNENSVTLPMHVLMESPEGWGRSEGRELFQKLLHFVEGHPGVMVFRVSLKGINRIDISFASETIVELAKRFRGSKGFCFIDLDDLDMEENWSAAAERKKQPLMSWKGASGHVIGLEPTQGNIQAFEFALQRESVRAAEFATAIPNMSIANASSKFKQLWEQGFLLRREESAESGGVEFMYYRIS